MPPEPMAELLLELLTEEIPARMQARAAEDLQRLVVEKLGAVGLAFAKAESFVTPRRLTLMVEGLPMAQPDASEERRGPRVGAPANAIEGFLKSAGLASLAECEERDTGKGVFYFAVIRRAGRPTADVLPELLRAGRARAALAEIDALSRPRASAGCGRWRASSRSSTASRLALALDDVPVATATRGHRFLAPEHHSSSKASPIIATSCARRMSCSTPGGSREARSSPTVSSRRPRRSSR